MINTLYHFLFGTLRGRLVVGVAAVHAVMMTLFIVDLSVRQRAMLLDRQLEEATALSQTLSTSAAGWIAARDIAGLQELVEAQRRYPEMLFVILVDEEGHVLADIDASRRGRYMLDLPREARQTVFSGTPSLVDVAAPAMIGGRCVGWARVGIGQKAAGEKLAEITRSGVVYALAAILIGSVIAWFMGRRISRRLYTVQETIDAVRSGNRLARSPLAGVDEAAVMAREFNSMLDALAGRDAALRRELDVNRAMSELSQALISGAASLQDVADATLRFAQALTGSTHGFVSFIDPRSGDNVAYTLTSMMEKGCPLTGADRRITFPVGPDGRYPRLWGHALNTRQAFYTNSPATHAASAGTPRGHVPLRNFLAVPALVKHKLVGEVALANADRDYTDEDLSVVTRLSSLYAMAAERAETENMLRDSEQRWRSLLQTVDVGVVIHDPETRVVASNATAQAVLGLSEEQMLGKAAVDSAWRFVKEDGTPMPLDLYPVNQVVSAGRAVRSLVLGVLRPNRTETTWALVNADPVYDSDGTLREVIVGFMDITERKRAEEELRRIEWLLTKTAPSTADAEWCTPRYGNLSELNTARTVLDSVGQPILRNMAGDYLDVLGTSGAVYEKNGDYALGIFTSGWCQFLDSASRNLCGTDDNREALASGKWLCHESCWTQASKVAIESGQPVDIECHGGIRLYAVPIVAGSEVVGAINVGYGDPPRNPQKLQEIADKYRVQLAEVLKRASEYGSRPPYIVELAKKRLCATAALIGEVVERKRIEARMEQQLHELQRWYGVTLTREGRVQELKQEVNRLLRQLGEPGRYGE